MKNTGELKTKSTSQLVYMSPSFLQQQQAQKQSIPPKIE